MSYDGPERRKVNSVFTKEEKETLLQNVKDIKIILTGNGHPENGLVYKSQKNTDFRLFWEKFGWLILAAIATPSCAVVVMSLFNSMKGA